jgi:hypothetical protein
MTRKYSSTSVEQLLDAPMGAADTTLALDNAAAVTALLGGVTLAPGNVDQFTIVVDPDTASEEIIFARGTSGNQLTGLLRGQAGTSSTTHSAGATVKHVLTSNDLDYYTAGVDASITASSTSTLTNKNLTSATNTFPSSLATLTGSETLTNKTLTAPVINLSLNAQTGTTYTFVLADNGKLVTASNAATQTYSIPTNASVAFPVGTQINIVQLGAGQVTINAVTPGTTTITSTAGTPAAPKLRAQYSTATCVKTATDTWLVVGDIS